MNSFKKIASDAKKRLVNGYWEDIYRSRDEDIKVAVQNGVSSNFVVDAYKQRVNASITKEDKIVTDEFYQKVYDIVLRENSGEIIINPISLLQDEDYSAELNDFARQRYVLEISDAYVTTKKRIIKDLKIKSLKELLD